MERLSSGAEQLLKDIFEHRLENGTCDLDYWSKRFKALESDFSLEMQVRSQFGTLREERMINVQWADNVPYILFILDHGFAYYERFLKGSVNLTSDVKIFASYNQESGSQFVDALEKKLDGKATLIRDKTHLESWGSIFEFMRSIRDQDFAVAVITDPYLKSQACMYEIATMMREKDWQERLIPAVLDTSIYKRSIEYVDYWEGRKHELEEKSKNVSGLSIITTLAKNAKEINMITSEISDFLAFVLDSKNPPVYSVLDEIEQRVLSSAERKSIPEAPKDDIELKQAREKLSDYAQKLLVRAAKAQKRIMFMQDLCGYFLGLDGEEGERPSNDRTAALWIDAIKELQALKLIEATDMKRTIFQLTYRGYEIADKLDAQSQIT